MGSLCRSGVLIPPHYGGEVEILRLFPPIFRDPGGEIGILSPPYFETLGGKFHDFPPKMGGKSPPQAENFEDFDS